MTGPVRTLSLPASAADRADTLIEHEWLVTNGLGGYASSTLAGVPTRRYHGVLVSALANPHGRTVMLTELSERVRLSDGTVARLSGEDHAHDRLEVYAAEFIEHFALEWGLPVWRYRFGSALLEKRLWMPYGQNTVHVRYKLLEGDDAIRLNLRPALNYRAVEDPVSTPLRDGWSLTAREDRIEVSVSNDSLPPLRMRVHGERHGFTLQPQRLVEQLYRVESDRGYDDTGVLWSPGYHRVELRPGDTATLIASTESWSDVLALQPEDAFASERERRSQLLARAPERCREGIAAELTLAADAFVVTPAYRAEDVARRRAAGDELRSVIAGYHWFTDWGRDTMIALEGLTLCTGRHREAGEILRTFAQYTRDGLIPNMFPGGSSDGLYHTADASLWFFHAVDRYVLATGDRATLDQLLPVLHSIARHHLDGTRFGIRVDPDDGLLTQGEDGMQLTWMDAKVDDWVVTPRRGKPVEINALWYNALRLLEQWSEDAGEHEQAVEYATHAERACVAFNRRFWNDDAGCLHDVVDGAGGADAAGSADSAVRPNQLLAISLPHPVLARERWDRVLGVCRDRLLTPAGMRSLAPGSEGYQPNYHGDLRARDAAYHQGTVWPWLIGPFIDAWLRAYPDDAGTARTFLDGLIEHLDEFGVGSIAEIFDAEPPFTPRGCIAQAWSVAEVLRCWLRTEA